MATVESDFAELRHALRDCPMVISIRSFHQGVTLRIVLDSLCLGIKTQNASNPRGNIGQVDDRRSAMPFTDAGVKLLLIATYAIEEVRVMRRQRDRALPLGDEFHFGAVQPPSGCVTEDQHSVGSVEGCTVIVTFLRMRRPDPLLEDQLFLASLRITLDGILEGRILGIRELLIVIKKITNDYNDAFAPQLHCQVVQCLGNIGLLCALKRRKAIHDVIDCALAITARRIIAHILIKYTQCNGVTLM